MRDASWTIAWHDELVSTNDRLKQEARAGAPDRTVVVAKRQTHGRGRGTNRWSSPPGGLYASLLLRDVPGPLRPLLAFVAGEALCRTLEALRFRTPFWLKWPNDLLIAPPGESRPVGKAAGVLVETVSSGHQLAYAIVGIGVNLHTAEADLPSDQDPAAVSFRTFQERVPDVALFLDILLTNIERTLAIYAAAPERLVQAVQARLAWGGEQVVGRLVSGETVEGTLLGLAPNGGLRLDTARGQRVVEAWDVQRLDKA